MNELMSALKVRSFENVLSAYQQAGIDLHDAIDGGAGSGKTAQEMMPFLGPHARIYAFEPFPGNHRFFETIDRRVQLIPSALAEAPKSMSFAVSSVVEPGSKWAELGMLGYSSMGRLVDEPTKMGKQLVVDCVRADSIVPKDRKIGFIKLDLQGGELNALKGCTEILQDVALMWVEYSGQAGLLEFLEASEFMLFDTEYFFLGDPTPHAQTLFHVSRKNVTLSINAKAWFGFKKRPWKAFEADLFKCKKELQLVQTDLLCVSRRHLKKFTAAISYL